MDSSERKAWEKTQRTNRIVDIAQEVFFRYGYHKSTMDRIADAAGYKKRTLYLYFRDKESLFLAVVLRGLKILNGMLQAAYEDRAPEETRLGSLGRAFYDFSIRYPEFAELIMIYEAGTCVYYPAADPPSDPLAHSGRKDLRAACQAVTDADADLVTRAIADGVARSAIRSDMTPRQLMLIVWGQIVGLMQVIQMRKKYFSDAYGIGHDEMFDRFMEMAEKGLAP